MARTRTLTNLIADVRLRADMVNSTFCSDAEITEYINQSIAAFYGILIGARGQDYFENSTTVTTVAGTTLYNLPADFGQLLAVEANLGGVVRPVKPFMRKEHGPWSEQSVPGGYVFNVYYTPAPTRLSAGSDTFDGIMGWEEWVVLDAAIKCMAKEESDVSILAAQKAAIEKQVEQLAGDRDAGWPERITDTSRDHYVDFTLGAPRYRLKGPSALTSSTQQIEILWGPVPGWGW
jgi:hypothetical protein